MPDTLVERIYHLNLLPHRRSVTVYATGSAMVRTVRSVASSAQDGAAHAQLDDVNARGLVDALAAATGHYPQTLDAQRAHTAGLAGDLAARRLDGDELAGLAHSRHLGHLVGQVADALYELRSEFLGDRTVAEMFAELAGMVDAMRVGGSPSNPEARVDGHYARITELREQLPTPGKTA